MEDKYVAFGFALQGRERESASNETVIVHSSGLQRAILPGRETHHISLHALGLVRDLGLRQRWIERAAIYLLTSAYDRKPPLGPR